jgi:hypothetical protein
MNKLDFRKLKKAQKAEITKEQAQAVYASIKKHGTAGLAFEAGCGHDPEHYKIVEKEVLRVFDHITKLKSGQFVISIYDKGEGLGYEYFDPKSTKPEYKAKLKSWMFNVGELLTDYLDYHDYKSFNEFINDEG